MEVDIEHKIKKLSLKERDLLITELQVLLAKKNEKAQGPPNKLVGYLTTSGETSISEILAELKVALPDYMVPSSLHILDKIPVLPNGKIDRMALEGLKLISSKELDTGMYEPNNGIRTIEQGLIAIWEEVLNVRPIHKTDNFFEIGGDSILSIQIIAKARKQGIEIKPNQIFDYQTIGDLTNALSLIDKPAITGMEDSLVAIWEEVLNVKPIHLDDNFFEIGGDSILSIQIIAKARKLGILIEPRELFDYQTIRQLVLLRDTKKESLSEAEVMVVGKVPLTPIQHWFFETHKNAPDNWNQGVRITRLHPLSKKQLGIVMESLIKKHDSLRLSFAPGQNGWTGNVLPLESISSFEYVELPLGGANEQNTFITNFLKDLRMRFNLSIGGLFKCYYFADSDGSNTTCILLAHHLVIDAVSWQLVLDDFKSAYEQIINGLAVSMSSKTTSIKAWATYLKEWATSDYLTSQLTYWQQQTVDMVKLPTDLANELPLLEKNSENIDFALDKATTSQLLKANTSYSTKTDELMVTALVDCLLSWTKGTQMNISLERHGREIDNTSLDPSNTVGWLTSYFPVKIGMKTNDIGEKIKSVKEQLRHVPDGGIGYGVLKYLGASLSHPSITIATPPVLFNFLGTRNKSSENDSNFLIEALHNDLRDPMSERYYLFEINSFISNGQLYVDWSYGDEVYLPVTVEKLINDFKTSLIRVIEHCVNLENKEYTPSDFPEAQLNQDDLDNLLNTLD